MTFMDRKESDSYSTGSLGIPVRSQVKNGSWQNLVLYSKPLHSEGPVAVSYQRHIFSIQAALSDFERLHALQFPSIKSSSESFQFLKIDFQLVS